MKTFQTFLDMVLENKLKSNFSWEQEPLYDENHPEHNWRRTESECIKKKPKLDEDQPEKYYLRKYTVDSRFLNGNLARLHKARKEKNREDIQKHKDALRINYNGLKQVKHLDDVLDSPIGEHAHVYSGLHVHPIRAAREEHGDKAIDSTGHVGLHMPAYTSTTFERSTASMFAREVRRGETYKRPMDDARDSARENDRHILHLHLKPTDKARAVDDESENNGEHEVILPRNTRVKIHKTPSVYRDNMGRRIFIWHGHVHSQETPPSIEHEDGDDGDKK